MSNQNERKSNNSELKKIAYIGIDKPLIQMIGKLVVDKAIFEELSSLKQFEEALKNKNFDALIIEEGSMSGSNFHFVEASNEIPCVLISPHRTRSQIAELKKKFGIPHIIEEPFSKTEAGELIDELINYQKRGPEAGPLELFFKEYTNTIDAKLENVESLANRVLASPSRDTVEALKIAVHKISGSAGTFGYLKAGEVCKSLVLLLSNALEADKFNQELISEVERHYHQINFYFNSTFCRNFSKKDASLSSISQQKQEVFRVLVVDDDIDLCNFIIASLEDPNIIVQTMSDETKIVECIYEFHPNLLLLDIHLKYTDGWSLLAILRKDLRYHNLQTIIITATNDPQALKHLHQECDDIWVKPLDAIQLRRNILSLAETSLIHTNTKPKPSIFMKAKNFKALLQTIVSIAEKRTPAYFLVVCGADQYSAIVKAGYSAEEEYLISSENLFIQSITGDSLHGYLGDGLFAFVFSHGNLSELESLIDRFLLESDYKIIIKGADEELLISYSASITSFQPSLVNVDELIKHAIESYKKTALQTTRRVVISEEES